MCTWKGLKQVPVTMKNAVSHTCTGKFLMVQNENKNKKETRAKKDGTQDPKITLENKVHFEVIFRFWIYPYLIFSDQREIHLGCFFK